MSGVRAGGGGVEGSRALRGLAAGRSRGCWQVVGLGGAWGGGAGLEGWGSCKFGIFLLPFGGVLLPGSGMGNTIVSKIGRGNVISYEGHPCVVLERTIHTPPNLASFCSMELRNIRTGKVAHLRTNVGDSYNVLHKEMKTMEFSYMNGDMYAFMDVATFEQIELPESVIGEAKPFLVEGKEYELFLVDDEVMGVQLPSSIELEVVEAPEMLRGDTSGNVQKTVVVSTGLEIRTPAFIKVGDVIKINPADKSYQGRA